MRFFRFWKLSGDRLFLLFAIAFWVFAVEAVVLAVVDPLDVSRHYVSC